jgi:hypothetical protein
MKELRETLLEIILNAKDKKEIECPIRITIELLRKHMVNEFVIAQFMNKLTCELRAKGFKDEAVFEKIHSLHPCGGQWQF